MASEGNSKIVIGDESYCLVGDTYLKRLEQYARWSKIILAVLVLDILITPAIGVSQYLNNKELRHTQNSLRATQIGTLNASYTVCKLNNDRAQAQIDYQNFILAQQRKSLEQIKTIPTLNTPEIRRLAIENQQEQIDASNRFIDGYKLVDCGKFIPPKKK